MKTTHEIEVNNEPVILDVEYFYFKEDGQVTINIESIMCDGIDVSTSITPTQHQNIVDDCQTHYENHKFNEIEKVFNRIHYGIEDNLDTEV